MKDRLVEALGRKSFGCIGRISVAIVQGAKNKQDSEKK